MVKKGKQAIIDSRFLQMCDIPEQSLSLEPFTMVIFGGAGDLSKRKLLPSLLHLYREKELAEFEVIAFDMLAIAEQEYLAMMKDAVTTYATEVFEEEAWREFATHLHFISGHFEEDENYRGLAELLNQVTRPTPKATRIAIYYMAVPPHVAPLVIDKLKNHDLCKGRYNARIVMEKPFGTNRASAADLNRVLTDAFDEPQIYRIDHYLARDPVQNIIFFRFSNTLFEEIWDHRLVDNVQITVAEKIGIEHRGAFYEQAGVVRDIVQNHILQILGLVAMEPPIGFDAESIRDEKLKIMRSVRPIDGPYVDKFMVRGQYGRGRVDRSSVAGYREEPDVSPSSTTSTYFAGKFYIDNLRWAGVPFFVRTGKRMPTQVTEVCVELKRLPLRLFGRTCDSLDPNILILTVQPDERITLRFGVKYPYSNNQIFSANMVFNYGETFKVPPHSPYERLLIDLIKGDLTLFVREDTIEAMWAVVDPIISRWEEEPPESFPNYAAGTWGPPEARHLIEREGRNWITGAEQRAPTRSSG